jgi:hypothetical protein
MTDSNTDCYEQTDRLALQLKVKIMHRTSKRRMHSHILFIITIGEILVLFLYITRLASHEIFSPSNKIHREVGRAKDSSAPLYSDQKRSTYPLCLLQTTSKQNTFIQAHKSACCPRSLWHNTPFTIRRDRVTFLVLTLIPTPVIIKVLFFSLSSSKPNHWPLPSRSLPLHR